MVDMPNTTPTGGVHTIVRPWNKWLKSVDNYRNWGCSWWTNRKAIALIINHKRRMKCSLWSSENVNSTTFSWSIPIDNPVSIPGVTPKVNTGAPSWWLTPGSEVEPWEKLVINCGSEGAQCLFPLHSLLSLPPLQFIIEPDWSQLTEQTHGAVSFSWRWLELNFLHCSYYLYNYFRQTVQWSMILESSMSNGVVCWTESFTLAISSIKRTTRWMFCKTKLITCELTASKTNGCSVVTY